MSEATLTVPTAFVDIAQLAEGLEGRVEPDKLMLYGPSPFEDGTEVRFAVTLNDGSSAFEGVGRAIQSVDGGEERPEVARFDIILDSLAFAGTGQVVYDRVLQVAYGEGQETGEVDLNEVEAHAADDVAAFADSMPADAIESDYPEDATIVAAADTYASVVDATGDRPASTNPPPASALDEEYSDTAGTVAAGEDPFEVAVESYSEPPSAGRASTPPPVPTHGGAPGDDTHIVDFADVEDSSDEFLESLPPGAEAIPVPPSEAPPQILNPGTFGAVEPTDGALLRGSVRASWHPEPIPSPQPSGIDGGLFNFGATLPIPERVPRPDLDPSQRIQPAPRPAEGTTAGSDGSNGAYAAPDEGHGLLEHDGEAAATEAEAPLDFDDLPETAQADPLESEALLESDAGLDFDDAGDDGSLDEADDV